MQGFPFENFPFYIARQREWKRQTGQVAFVLPIEEGRGQCERRKLPKLQHYQNDDDIGRRAR
jgi:hypothetical protein